MRQLWSGLWESWREIGGYIADFQSRLLLTLFYFTVAAPFGLLTRLTGDRLRMRRRPAPSAWTNRRRDDADPSDSHRQF